jgi:hypothetical protein
MGQGVFPRLGANQPRSAIRGPPRRSVFCPESTMCPLSFSSTPGYFTSTISFSGPPRVNVATAP